MPFLEILAPTLPPASRARMVADVTAGLCDAFAVLPETVTLYYIDIAPGQYGHAGQLGPGTAAQRVLVKLHAYRRDPAARRRAAAALTPPIARGYGVPDDSVALYFIDRATDEVAHGGQLSSDAEPD